MLIFVACYQFLFHFALARNYQSGDYAPPPPSTALQLGTIISRKLAGGRKPAADQPFMEAPLRALGGVGLS